MSRVIGTPVAGAFPGSGTSSARIRDSASGGKFTVVSSAMVWSSRRITMCTFSNATCPSAARNSGRANADSNWGSTAREANFRNAPPVVATGPDASRPQFSDDNTRTPAMMLTTRFGARRMLMALLGQGNDYQSGADFPIANETGGEQKLQKSTNSGIRQPPPPVWQGGPESSQRRGPTWGCQ